MTERMQYHRPTERSSGHEYTGEQAAQQQEEDRRAQEAQELKPDLTETDKLLDEIDMALEGLTIEVVTKFKQKGGE